ncbi:hypothetical protein [Candidatus Binatus sp.]|uniref:hypothetical protein n=1 Tax=Candidatus Binatus sp. TaxID=2811406 RepID=UPI003CB9A074
MWGRSSGWRDNPVYTWLTGEFFDVAQTKVGTPFFAALDMLAQIRRCNESAGQELRLIPEFRLFEKNSCSVEIILEELDQMDAQVLKADQSREEGSC